MDVVIDSISKIYSSRKGAVEAVRNVSLEVAAGEFVAIVGPSGCGKSTLLEIVAGLTAPTDGEVRLGGRVVHGPACECAILFQEYALFPWRTVAGNIRCVLEVRKIPRGERARLVRRYLRIVDLEQFADAYPAQLSGGMRQRVALARALAAEPRVLLLDEPLAAADAITRRQLQETLGALIVASGWTSLLVTHSIEEAVRLADRVLVFSPRPAVIRTEFRVDVAREHRDDAAPELAALEHEIWSVLKGELGGADTMPAPGSER
jgi:NitT/TauT family transport system ATP-binding protein